MTDDPLQGSNADQLQYAAEMLNELVDLLNHELDAAVDPQLASGEEMSTRDIVLLNTRMLREMCRALKVIGVLIKVTINLVQQVEEGRAED